MAPLETGDLHYFGMEGYRVQELAPLIYDGVPARIRKTQTIHDALSDGFWAHAIGLELNEEQLVEFFNIWDRDADVELHDMAIDTITWTWEKNGWVLTRSAYVVKFWDREVSPTASFTWKSRAPLQCKFFSWLAIKGSCWTSDRLARRGLPHQDKCPLCGQQEEMINHILLQCVFARHIWVAIGMALDLPDWTPMHIDVLAEWCISKAKGSYSDKDIRTIITLSMWIPWKHRNAIMFNRATPSLGHVVIVIGKECRSWSKAGLIKGDLEVFFGKLARWGSARSN